MNFSFSDITVVLGVDRKHLEELRWVWPTWMAFKPELRQMPCLVFYDAAEVPPSALDFLNDHPCLRLIPWELSNAWNQREKMLTGFVQVPAREVSTPWYLKLDTDLVATGTGEWLNPLWFTPDDKGNQPVFIAPRWGYSKPRYIMDLLDDWADGRTELADHPRLNLPYASTSSKVRHARIISWFFLGRTDWTRKMATLTSSDGRLPFPSQDSFMFYCAARLGCYFIREDMKAYRWTHKRLRHIKELVTGMGFSPAA